MNAKQHVIALRHICYHNLLRPFVCLSHSWAKSCQNSKRLNMPSNISTMLLVAPLLWLSHTKVLGGKIPASHEKFTICDTNEYHYISDTIQDTDSNDGSLTKVICEMRWQWPWVANDVTTRLERFRSSKNKIQYFSLDAPKSFDVFFISSSLRPILSTSSLRTLNVRYRLR